MAEFRLRDAGADRRMADTPSLTAYLPRLLLYPVSGHALPALAMFTLFLWVGLQNILGIALLAIVSPWVLHYAEGIIEKTALGQATPPLFGGDMIFLGSVSALRPLTGVALLAGAYVWARPAGAEATMAVLVLGALLFPAFMLVLAVNNSLLAALNPLRLLHVMVAVGAVYPALSLLLAVTATGAALAVGQASLGLALASLIYAWLFVCHLLGFVAFHRAERLGLAAKARLPAEERHQQEQQQTRLDTLLVKIDAALARKDFQAAADALYAESGGPADFRVFHEDLFEQLQRRHQPALLHVQGQRLITLLLNEKRAARALDIAETCFDAHCDFLPEVAAQAVLLAEQALHVKREGLFERLIREPRTRYPAEIAISLEFLSAQYWAEQRKDEVRAREILKPLLAATQHERHRQITAYARALSLN